MHNQELPAGSAVRTIPQRRSFLDFDEIRVRSRSDELPCVCAIVGNKK